MIKTKKPGKTSRYRTPLLTLTEEERLRGELAEEERYLRAARGRDRVSDDDNPDVFLAPSQAKGISMDEWERRVARKRRALGQLSPRAHKLTGVERNRAFAKMKEHEGFFRKNMLSVADMGAYPKSDHEKQQNYMKAVEKSIAQEVGNSEFQWRAQEYKELARRLDPDNPELPNIERFRPKRRY